MRLQSGLCRASSARTLVVLGLTVPVIWGVVGCAPSSPDDRVIRVGVVQMVAATVSVEDSRARAEQLIREAAAQGAGFVLLPELYAMFPAARAHASMEAVRAEAQPIPGPLTDAMVTLARELDVQIAFGMSEREGDLLYNTIALVGPEGVGGRYRKRVLIGASGVKKYFEKLAGAPVALDPSIIDEATMFTKGTHVVVVPWGDVPTGVLTCADGGFDSFWKKMRRDGAEMILWPTSSLGTFTEEQISPMDEAAALGVPVLFANRAQPDLGLGNSMIVDRDGRIVAQTGDDYDDAVLVADVHLPPAR